MVETERLIQQLINAKKDEAAVKACRVALELDLVKRLGCPDEGSKTHTVGAHKVTVSQRVNRTVDWETMNAIEAEYLPIKTKQELDLPGLRWIAENDKPLYLEVAKAVTAKPEKPSVKVKEKKK